MKERYIIELDMRCSPGIEAALRDFMGEVFQAAEDSKCSGHGLSITKLEDK